MNMADPGWDFYRSFLAVMREGSLSAAARTLGLTQPTLARHIDLLEEALGCRLFTRSQRGLAPTDAAHALLPDAESLAATVAAMRRTASGHGREGVITGHVRISASEVVGAELLPPILADLNQRHPGLVVELVLSNQVDDLLLRQADIAVRMVAPAQDSLLARHVGGVRLGLYAHRRYLDRRGVPESWADLASHSVVGYDRETPAIRAMRERAGIVLPPFSLRADSDLAQLAAIRAGFGIGICQSLLAQRDPALVLLLADQFQMNLDTWIAMHEDLRQEPRCRAAFDALADGLAALLQSQDDQP